MSENLRSILKEKSSGHYNRFLYIETQTKDILPKIRTVFPEYNNHDIKHAENVEKILNDLLPISVKEGLNCDEILFLLSSVWLHDIGMVLERKEEKKFNIADINGKEKIRTSIRNTHHVRSYHFIKKNALFFKLGEREADAIGNICRAHRDINIEQELTETYNANKEEVRLQFLGACLRLADECDIPHRVSKYFLEENRSALDFIPHMRKIELIHSISYNINDKKLDINAKISSEKDLSIYKKTKNKIQSEIDVIKPILKKNQFILNGITDYLEDDELIEKDIILTLMDGNSKNFKKLCSAIEKDEIKIKKNLENLEVKSLVEVCSNGDYKLIKNVDCFNELFNIFYGDIDLKTFISYNFSKDIIENQLLNYLREMYNAPYTNPKEAKERVELLKNSPTAIYLSLNGNELLLKNPNLDQSLIQGGIILDQIIVLGLTYDTYIYPTEIKDVTGIINSILGKVAEDIPKYKELYEQAQENAKKRYSENYVDNITKREPQLSDMIKASSVTGVSIELVGDRIPPLKFSEEIKDFDISKIKALVLSPSPVLLRLDVKAGNIDCGFKELQFRAWNEGTSLHLSTENRELPYIFDLCYNKEKGIKFNSKIENYADVTQLYSWEKLLKKLNEKREFSLVNSKDNEVILSSKIPKLHVGGKVWCDFLKKLNYIQKNTNKVLKLPKDYKIKENDFKNAEIISELLKSGNSLMEVNDASATFKVINVKEMMKILKENKEIPFRMEIPNYQLEIVDTIIDLGTVALASNDFNILNEDKILLEMEGLHDTDSIKIKIYPKDGKFNLIRK